tara:strand:- start:59 stop:262 length:204 start_codon:yes stop_codon:yes gene_type:complete
MKNTRTAAQDHQTDVAIADKRATIEQSVQLPVKTGSHGRSSRCQSEHKAGISVAITQSIGVRGMKIA